MISSYRLTHAHTTTYLRVQATLTCARKIHHSVFVIRVSKTLRVVARCEPREFSDGSPAHQRQSFFCLWKKYCTLKPFPAARARKRKTNSKKLESSVIRTEMTTEGFLFILIGTRAKFQVSIQPHLSTRMFILSKQGIVFDVVALYDYELVFLMKQVHCHFGCFVLVLRHSTLCVECCCMVDTGPVHIYLCDLCVQMPTLVRFASAVRGRVSEAGMTIVWNLMALSRNPHILSACRGSAV